MPGTTSWTDGAADGNWSTAGNWSTSGGSTPPDTDDAVIIATGGRDITAGLATAKQFASITVTEGFKFNIGTSSSALSVTNITGTAKICVAGTFIKLTASGTIAALNVSFRSRGLFSLASGTATAMRASGTGTLEIDAAAVVPTLRLNGPTCTAGAGTAFTTVYVGAGQLTTSRSIGTLVGSNSKIIMLGTAAISTSSIITSGCNVSHQSSGTTTLMEMFAGSSWSPAGNLSTSVTITTLIRHVGASLEREYNGTPITITNPETLV